MYHDYSARLRGLLNRTKPNVLAERQPVIRPVDILPLNRDQFSDPHARQRHRQSKCVPFGGNLRQNRSNLIGRQSQLFLRFVPWAMELLANWIGWNQIVFRGHFEHVPQQPIDVEELRAATLFAVLS